MSLDGVSLRDVLSAADAAEPRTSQYYECWGSRAMYEDGWKVVTDHVNQLTHSERDLIAGSSDFATDRWHLYDTRSDPAENHDLGGRRTPSGATASSPAGTRRPSATGCCRSATA